MSDPDIETIKQWVIEFEQRFAEMKAFSEELLDRVTVAEKEQQDLRAEYEQLKAYSAELVAEFAEFKAFSEEIKAEYAKLQADLLELREESAELKAESAELKVRSDKMEARLEMIEKERDMASLGHMSVEGLQHMMKIIQAEILGRQWKDSLAQSDSEKADKKMARKMGACIAPGNHLIVYTPGHGPDELLVSIAN